MKLKITSEQYQRFPGDWSYSPALMEATLPHVEFEGVLNILEFGAGAGTEALANLLQDLKIESRYVSYENNAAFVPQRSDVMGVHWTTTPSQLVPGPYDLIIIDGPKGAETNTRMRWFPLLRPVVKEGTILVVDDHYANPRYAEELNKNFEFKTLAYKERPKRGVDNWRVVKILAVKELQDEH